MNATRTPSLSLTFLTQVSQKKTLIIDLAKFTVGHSIFVTVFFFSYITETIFLLFFFIMTELFFFFMTSNPSAMISNSEAQSLRLELAQLEKLLRERRSPSMGSQSIPRPSSSVPYPMTSHGSFNVRPHRPPDIPYLHPRGQLRNHSNFSARARFSLRNPNFPTPLTEKTAPTPSVNKTWTKKTEPMTSSRPLEVKLDQTKPSDIAAAKPEGSVVIQRSKYKMTKKLSTSSSIDEINRTEEAAESWRVVSRHSIKKIPSNVAVTQGNSPCLKLDNSVSDDSAKTGANNLKYDKPKHSLLKKVKLIRISKTDQLSNVKGSTSEVIFDPKYKLNKKKSIEANSTLAVAKSGNRFQYMSEKARKNKLKYDRAKQIQADLLKKRRKILRPNKKSGVLHVDGAVYKVNKTKMMKVGSNSIGSKKEIMPKTISVAIPSSQRSKHHSKQPQSGKKSTSSPHKTTKSKVKKHCVFYIRFGKCNNLGSCPYVHDPERVAVCTRFLRGTCKVQGCPFSHEVAPEKMPVCSYFLRGSCSKNPCPYLHVRVNEDADVCQEFVSGYCVRGAECDKKHIMDCGQKYEALCKLGIKCSTHGRAKKIGNFSKVATPENSNLTVQISEISGKEKPVYKEVLSVNEDDNNTLGSESTSAESSKSFTENFISLKSAPTLSESNSNLGKEAMDFFNPEKGIKPRLVQVVE